MKALGVIYGGRLEPEAFEELLPGAAVNESAFSLALAAIGRFPGVEKTVFLGQEGKKYPANDTEIVLRSSWTRKSLLEEVSKVSVGYDFVYFTWADCPLLDTALAANLAERHVRYNAEYSYADGWPYGFAPELLSHQTAGILAKLSENDDSPIDRDAIFQIIQKDINAFDIETEISPVDLRPFRLSLAADSKRNLLLIRRLMEAGLKTAADAEKIISESPTARAGLLRTLPAFFNIQVSGACPQVCSFCPWPVYGGDVLNRKDFMPKANFERLLDKIIDFAGDAVIDLSLWGELALHPDSFELIKMVLERPALSLIVETSGIGWKSEDINSLAGISSKTAPRKNHMAALSWIVSLDAYDSGRYKEIRGPGFSEAQDCAKNLLKLFPKDTYIQALRIKGFEDDIEHFYRYWKDEGAKVKGVNDSGQTTGHIIIQKYDDFAGALPKLQASDLSPVKRLPCWHIIRDMNILLDGTVPYCRQDLAALKGESGKGILGNVFSDDLEIIWEKGAALYIEHCREEYGGICSSCDEYYTYNF